MQKCKFPKNGQYDFNNGFNNYSMSRIGNNLEKLLIFICSAEVAVNTFVTFKTLDAAILIMSP